MTTVYILVSMRIESVGEGLVHKNKSLVNKGREALWLFSTFFTDLLMRTSISRRRMRNRQSFMWERELS